MSKKILIIDDEPAIREVILDFLRESGFTAFEAGNGKDGLMMIEKESPDLVLLDIKMPDVDGLQVLREINERFRNVVVIILSGMHEIEIAKQAIRLGACDYLTKPISPEMLIENYINRILK